MAVSDKKDGASWYYILDRVENGKRKQTKKRGFKTKREAEKAYVEAKNELNKGTYIEPSRLLYSTYLEEWMRNRKSNLGKQTFEVNMGFIKCHILPSLGNVILSNIRPATIQSFITELVEKGLAPSTVKRIYSIVNCSLNNAEKLQIVSKNYASLVEKPKLQQKELQVWDVQTVQKFLETAKESRYYIVFHLAIMTGMRQGEILGLRWIDIDFDNKLISIRQTLSHNGKEITFGTKTGAGRSISIDDEIITALKEYRELVLEEKHLAGEMYEESGLIVCNTIGRKAYPRSLSKIWDRLRSKANVPAITFHDLRHTHASLLLRQNIHPKIVAERLGHSSIQMTMDIYTHLMPNMQSEAVTGLGKLIFPQKILCQS